MATFNVKINGIPATLEVCDGDIFSLQPPKELNQKQAAEFCGMSIPTFRKRNVPKNGNGRYSVDELRARMQGAK